LTCPGLPRLGQLISVDAHQWCKFWQRISKNPNSVVIYLGLTNGMALALTLPGMVIEGMLKT
jgi:hypothetical protein